MPTQRVGRPKNDKIYHITRRFWWWTKL